MIHTHANVPLTVLRLSAETPGYYSLYFERPRNFDFEPGDWIELGVLGGVHGVTGEHPSGGTVYSLASSPHEPELRITFRAGLSPFKKLLVALQPGDVLLIRQYGNDRGFYLSDRVAAVLIAGGVGVAPFRSMIKHMIDMNSANDVRIIYLSTTPEFLYRQEFDSWQTQLSGLDMHYIVTKDLKRKDREKTLGNLLPGPDQDYYIAGPTAMVDSTLKLLKVHGITMKSIKIDDFGLY